MTDHSPLKEERADSSADSSPNSDDFSCDGCGSPSVLFPLDLRGEAQVVCDRCRRPLATLAEFRERVARLIICADPKS
jgi:hypothetical protein